MVEKPNKDICPQLQRSECQVSIEMTAAKTYARKDSPAPALKQNFVLSWLSVIHVVTSAEFCQMQGRETQEEAIMSRRYSTEIEPNARNTEIERGATRAIRGIEDDGMGPL